MPLGKFKNSIYRLSLSMIGGPVKWDVAKDIDNNENVILTKILKKNKVVAGSIQLINNWELTQCYTFGKTNEEKTGKEIKPNTYFRTASLTKMVLALLVFRLKTLNLLKVTDSISDYLGYEVYNPYFPKAPITIAMLLSHTSTFVDTRENMQAMHEGKSLKQIFKDKNSYLDTIPGTIFRYSNIAFGSLGCILENKFSKSIEELIQYYLFEPFGIKSTFDITKLSIDNVADCYRVNPKKKTLCMENRKRHSNPIIHMNPQKHYQFGSGNLYSSSVDLAKLAILSQNGLNGFLDDTSLVMLRNPIFSWPNQEVQMYNCMGRFCLNDLSISNSILWGHQGFAYGSVNGIFINNNGDGFVQLNNGASEERVGHLAVLNKELISALLNN